MQPKCDDPVLVVGEQEENRQNSSKKNRRRAARMARIKDLFAQRDRDRIVASPESNEAMKDKPHENNQSEAQSLSEWSSKSEASPDNIDNSLETGHTATHSSSSSLPSVIDPEKVHLTDEVRLHGVEDAVDLQNKSLDLKDNRAPADCLDISQFVSTKKSIMSERVTSEVSNETIEVTSVTFGTVVAPLYQQAFGGPGSVSQNTNFCDDPVKAAIKTTHLLQSCIHADKGEVNCNIVNEDQVGGNAAECQEPEQECPHTSPIGPLEEKEASLSETKNSSNTEKQNDQDCTNTDVVPQTILGQPRTVNLFDAHLENPQISTEGRRLQGGEQEGDATHSVQKQTATEETAVEAPTLIKICPQAVEMEDGGKVVPDLDTLLPQREAEHVGDEVELQTSADKFSGGKPVLHWPEQQTQGGEGEDTDGHTAVQSEEKRSSQFDSAHHDSVCFSDSVGVKNWESMVEEEEENILMKENKSQAHDLEVEETEAAEIDGSFLPEDFGTKTVSENTGAAENERIWPEEDNGQKLDEKMGTTLKKQSENVGDAETDRGEESEEGKNTKQLLENKVDLAVAHEVKQIRTEVVMEGDQEQELQQEKEREEAIWTDESRPAVEELYEQPEEENTTKQGEEIEDDLSSMHKAKQILPQEEEEEEQEETMEMVLNNESKSTVEKQLDEVCMEEQSGFRGDTETFRDFKDQLTEKPEHTEVCESSGVVILTNSVAAPLVVDGGVGCFEENLVITPTRGPEDQSGRGEGDRVAGEVQEEAPQNPEHLLEGRRDPTDEEEQKEVKKEDENEEQKQKEATQNPVDLLEGLGDPPAAEEENVEEKQEAPQNPGDLQGGHGDPPVTEEEVVVVEKKEDKTQKQEAPHNSGDLLEGCGESEEEQEKEDEETSQNPGDLQEGCEDSPMGDEEQEEEEEEASWNPGNLQEGSKNNLLGEEEQEEEEKEAPWYPGDLQEGSGDLHAAKEGEEKEVIEAAKDMWEEQEEQGEKMQEEVVEEEQKGEEPKEPGSSQNEESSETDSEDEVELYMHCLRAVHAGEQAQRDQSRGAGLGLGGGGTRVLAFSRNKRPSATPMPSISESLDEEQPPGWLQDQGHQGHQGHEGHRGMADVRTAAPDLSDLMVQENISQEVLCWKDKFSCRSFTKTLLSATLFVVFVLVAYHYDFLACFGLYVISLIWLCCRGDSQPVKTNRIG